MKRFYATGIPTRSGRTLWLKLLRVPVNRFHLTGDTQYVVQVIRKIERSVPPVKVTVVK